MNWKFVTSLMAASACFAAVNLIQEPTFSIAIKERELKCYCPYYKCELGTLKLYGMAEGKSIRVIGSGLEYVLTHDGFGLIEQNYKNGLGQSLSFDGEIFVEGFFKGQRAICD